MIVDYAEYFSIQPNDGQEMKLSIQKPLVAEVLKLSFLTLSVVARKIANIDGIATILIEIDSKEQKAPSFEKVFYEGIIVEKDGTFVMEEIVLNAGTYSEDVKFQYSGKDLDNFKLTQIDNQIKVQLSEAFNIANVKDVSELMFAIEATKPGHADASTVVLVRISKFVIVKPRFEKSIYIGNKPDIGELVLENVVIMKETFDDSIVVLLQGEDADLFEVKKQNENVVQIGLKSAVLETEKEFLQFVVEATKIGLEVKEFASIFISVGQKNPATKALSFSKSIYEGSVTKDMKLIIEKVKLNEDNLDDDVVIQLSGRNQQFFTFTRTTNEILLSLKEGVTFDQLPNIPALLVSVDALSDKFRSASTNVVISLSMEINSNLKFQKSLYVGSVNNMKELILENLLIESNESINSHIEISGDDKELFSVDIIDNAITVSLQKDITEDLWNSRVILIINITALIDGMKIETIVVITLPKKSEDKMLLFEKPSYIGSIDLNTVLDLELIVLELNNYDSQVTFALSGINSELFVMQVDRNSVSLQLKEGVTIRDFENIVLISLEIKAKRDKFISGITIVFLQLPWKVEQVDFLSFDKISYRGKFNIDKVLLLETIKLDPTTFTADVSVSLKGDDAETFALTQTNNEIELILKQLTNLDNRSIFNLYVEAVRFGAPKAYANVVIDVEKMKKLSFDSLIYVGKLNTDYSLNFELTTVSGDMLSKDVSFALKNSDDIDLFEVKRQGNDLIIVNSTSITDDKLVNKMFFSFYLEASMDKFYSTISLIVIEIPMSNTSVPIDECIDKSDPSQPFFETGAYSFVLQSDMKGSFGRIRAMIIDPTMGQIQYKLQTANGRY